jgi:hypothetical protein
MELNIRPKGAIAAIIKAELNGKVKHMKNSFYPTFKK